jgi:hypothetical protein
VAADAPRRAEQYAEHAAQLIWLGHVLGVVHHQEIAVRKLQRVLDRTRLGARLAVGNHENAHVAG